MTFSDAQPQPDRRPSLPQEKKKSNEPLKVTDKRIFTSDGNIREEFRETVKPSDAPPPAPPAETPAPVPEAARPDSSPAATPPGKKTTPGENPETPFSNFVYTLAIQAFASLGMVRGMPMQLDIEGARQMIDILEMLSEKTAGNLSPEESEFLKTHLGDLKLAFVQRTKKI